MISLPVRLMPFVWAALAAGVIAVLFWLADAIGDAREASVRAEYREAARVKNVDLTKYNTAREVVDAIVEAELAARVAAAAAVPSELRYTPAQAAAITSIRRTGQ